MICRVVAANRDEFLDRPTDRAHFWSSAPHVIAGIDRAGERNYKGLAFKFNAENSSNSVLNLNSTMAHSANESPSIIAITPNHSSQHPQIIPVSIPHHSDIEKNGHDNGDNMSTPAPSISHTESERIIISSLTPSGRLFDLMHEESDRISVCSGTSDSRSPSPVSCSYRGSVSNHHHDALFHLGNDSHASLISSQNRDHFPPIEGHGTWIGMTRTGKFAFITNVLQHPSELIPDGLSRGFLVRDYLLESPHSSTRRFARKLDHMRKRFNGFNLVTGRIGEETWYIGNRASHSDQPRTRRLEKNKVYGIANAQFMEEDDQVSWPKVTKGSRLFEQVLDESQNEEDLSKRLLDLLSNSEGFHDTLDENSGHIDYKELRRLTPICIEKETSPTPNYGTRTHTVIIVDNDDKVLFMEVDRYKEHVMSEEEMESHGMNPSQDSHDDPEKRVRVRYVRGEFKNEFRFTLELEKEEPSEPTEIIAVEEFKDSSSKREDLVGMITMEEDGNPL